uniref:Mitogen-activated protein kinase n=1 Tax=Trichobilharzia regenti TaxID=157069 RepID=A0AA85KCM0_TRIRE|nr:unnamed protein product [Trichobilharzia regenti]
MMHLEVEPVILRNYEIMKRLGKGAYGIVWKARNRKTRKTVALKKIFDAFRNQTDAQRTFREISFLQEFSQHPNIIRLLNVIRAENDKDIYLVFEYMETDLHNCIKKGGMLKDIHRVFIFYQLLRAVKYIHSGNVIHRDLKPSNVLLNSDCLVKLCDFGLTRSLASISENRATSAESFIDGDEDNENPGLTEYVATRWYRAPEILLASNSYTKYVDMWSLGCILGEMLLGKALFPGTSTINQIERIVSAVERPSMQDIECLRSDYGKSVLEKALQKPHRPLKTLFPSGLDELAFDMLVKLIQLNPEKRLTVEQALNHNYVKRFRDPASEIVLEHPVTPILRDDKQLSVSDYRQKLYEIIMEKKAQHKIRKMLRSVELSEDGNLQNWMTSLESSTGELMPNNNPRKNDNYEKMVTVKHSEQKQNEQAVHPGNQRNVKTTEIKDQQYCSDCNDLKSKPGYCTSLNKVRSNNNGTFENERAIQSGSCSQINSTSKSSHTACPTNNKPTSNVSTKLSRHISMPISTASTGKYMSHLQSHMDKTHNYCQPTMMSMSREANNPVIVRGNKTTSPNSLKSVNNYPANRRSCINSSSSLSSGSPAPPPSAITTTTTIRSESKLFNHPICNYNQTYGTVSTSQLSQLHSRKWTR